VWPVNPELYFFHPMTQKDSRFQSLEYSFQKKLFITLVAAKLLKISK
jgi:hypothetical protein